MYPHSTLFHCLKIKNKEAPNNFGDCFNFVKLWSFTIIILDTSLQIHEFQRYVGKLVFYTVVGIINEVEKCYISYKNLQLFSVANVNMPCGSVVTVDCSIPVQTSPVKRR